MKRFIVLRRLKFFALFFVLAFLVVIPVANGQQEQVDVYENHKLVKSVVFQIGLKKYFVNNQLPGHDMDVAPFIENDRTFVPVRYLANALGVRNANIHWDGSAREVTLSEPGFPLVEMVIDVAEVLSNGKPVPDVDVAPMLVDPGRTMLPARFTAEALGYDVEWDPALRLVICWPKGEPKPDVGVVEAELRNWTWTEAGYRVPDLKGDLIDPLKTAAYEEGISWTKAGLEIDLIWTRVKVDAELQLLIMPPDYKGSWEAYDQAEEILASKFGPEFAGEVMNYVRQKKSWKDMVHEPTREYTAPNGQVLWVRFGGGTDILVWRSGIRP